jgi:Lipase (class 3)
MLRSCYETDWRFYRDSTTTVPVRWFFTDDAPALPFPTVFGARVWNDNKEERWPSLGEVQGAPRTYYKGTAPPVEFTGAPCGQPGRFLIGSRLPPDPPLVPPVWGVPPCCVSAPPQANSCNLWQIGLTDPAVLFGLCLGCWIANENDPALQIALSDLLLGPGATTAFRYQPNSFLLSWWACWNSSQAVVFVYGTANDAQLLYEAMASTLGPVDSGAFGVNPSTLHQGQALMSDVYSFGLPLDVPLTVTGHSAGGAAADFFAGMEQVLRPSRPVRVVTFGAPRFSDARLSLLLDAPIGYRIERLNDVVPWCPPDLRWYAWVLPTVGQVIASRWARYQPAGVGYALAADGSLSNQDPQGAPWGDLVALVGRFVLGGPGNLGANHYIEAYAGDLAAPIEGNVDFAEACWLTRPGLLSIWEELISRNFGGSLVFSGQVKPVFPLHGQMVVAGDVGLGGIVSGQLALSGQVEGRGYLDGGLVMAGTTPVQQRGAGSLVVAGELVAAVVLDGSLVFAGDVVSV